MNEPEEPLGGEPTPPASADSASQLLPAFVSVIVLTFLTGCIFPLIVAVPARLFFSKQASGSLLMRGNSVIGSELIGQNFTRQEYFHPRPSAAGSGYDAVSSGGTNHGINSPKLEADVSTLAEKYRLENGLGLETTVPIDAVTRSGSGLDPHISPDNAALQVARVSRARSLSEDSVRRLVTEYTQAPQLGILGSARVPVLELNMALDRLSATQPR
jgi:K+-transporting ATPase ATPase C chain